MNSVGNTRSGSDGARAARSRPQADDVIVSVQRPPDRGFALCPFSGEVQVRVTGRERALEIAQRFAVRERVDWQHERGAFTLLESYRPSPA